MVATLLSSTENSLLLKISSKRCFRSNGLKSNNFSMPSSTAREGNEKIIDDIFPYFIEQKVN